MDRVSVLLGHGSIKVAMRHYSPWVRPTLERGCQRSWKRSLPEGATRYIR
jgi:hypothetical protein